MRYANETECEAAGVDPAKVESIARRLSKAAREAQAMGLTVFGGSGTGSLRFCDSDEKGNLVVADLDGVFDGGDGAADRDGAGLLRGEYV